jgi:two-component system, LuxR family, response regulator FixJ
MLTVELSGTWLLYGDGDMGFRLEGHMGQSMNLASEGLRLMKPASEIFIVDDNEEWRETLSVILELEGYRVTGFSEGTSFLKEAMTRVPICIFLDVVMPGLSGLELLKKLKEESYAAPVFLVSARADEPVVIEGINNGALGFIEKPFDPYTAVLRVRDAVDIWARRAENGVMSALQSATSDDDVRLTRRECQVLALIASGASNKEIASNLDVTKQVAANYRCRIMKKFGTKSAAELVRAALAETGDASRELVVYPLRSDLT